MELTYCFTNKQNIQSYVIAETCYKTLLEYGEAAIASAQAGAVTPAFEHVVEVSFHPQPIDVVTQICSVSLTAIFFIAGLLFFVVKANTLLSGVGFESAGLGAAHAVHNGLSELPECHKFYHGEKVAMGVLTGLFFADAPKQVMEEVYGFCEAVGLPTTLADLGVLEVTDEKLDLVANRTVADGESIYNELKPVSAAAVKSALLAADMEGRRRKGKK